MIDRCPDEDAMFTLLPWSHAGHVMSSHVLPVIRGLVSFGQHGDELPSISFSCNIFSLILFPHIPRDEDPLRMCLSPTANVKES